MFVLPKFPIYRVPNLGVSMTISETTVRLKKLASSVLELSCMLLCRFCQAGWIPELGFQMVAIAAVFWKEFVEELNRPVFLDGLLIRYTRFRYNFFCEISNMIPLEGLEGLMMRQYVFVRWAFIADHVWQCTPAAKTDQTTVILVDDESSWLYQQGLQQW